jgi:two-component sensor histidine kinase
MGLDDLYRLLRDGHAYALGMVETLTTPMLVLDRSLCVVVVSRAFCETFQVQRDETVGRPIYELGSGQWDIPELRHLLEGVIPKSAAVEGYEVAADFPQIGRRTMLLNARRLFHPDNGGTTLLLTVTDVSQLRHEEAERNLLMGEMRHRVKNLLAVVKALANQTGTEGRSAEAYRDSFIGRLDALIHAHELSFQLNANTDLARLVEEILEPYTAEPGRLILEAGQAVSLPAPKVLPISLVLHELATNAAKHGAWSTPDGRVRIQWQVADQHMTLTWEEQDAPPVTPPRVQGFGTRLIESAGRELDGKAELTFAPEGLKAEISMPLV